MIGRTFDPQAQPGLRLRLVENVRRLHLLYATNGAFPDYDPAHFRRFEARIASLDLDRTRR